MINKRNSVVTSKFLALWLCPCLILTGCTKYDGSYGQGQFMPKGYKYSDNTPLSSPAPSYPLSYKATKNNTETITADMGAWKGAVFELLDSLEPSLPRDGTPLNLNTNSLKDSSLDHYLRHALINRGDTLTTTPDAGLPIVTRTEETKEKGVYQLVAEILDAEGKVKSTSSVTAVLP